MAIVYSTIAILLFLINYSLSQIESIENLLEEINTYNNLLISYKNQNQKSCVYKESDINCNECLPYTHFRFRNSTCSNCQSIFQNCLNCFTSGCEVCKEGYALYTNLNSNNIPQCAMKNESYNCELSQDYPARFNNLVSVCVLLNNIPVKIGTYNGFTIGLVVVICICVSGSLIYFFCRNRQRFKEEQKIYQHDFCSLCGKVNIEEYLKEKVKNNTPNINNIYYSEGATSNRNNLNQNNSGLISNFNSNNNLSNEKEADVRLNCGGFLCLSCEKNQIELFKTGNYCSCLTCGHTVIWYIIVEEDEKEENNNQVLNNNINNAIINDTSNLNDNLRMQNVDANNDISNIKPIKHEVVKDKTLRDYEDINSSVIVIEDNKFENEIKTENKIIENNFCKTNNHDVFNNVIKEEKQKEMCVICIKENPDAVIPCQFKPMHKLHRICLAEFYKSNEFKNDKLMQCPICRGNIPFEN